MAYCANCGAYIPDGESKCVACGYVAGSAAAAQAQKAENDSAKTDFMKEYEKQKAENKAKSEQWAQQANVNAHHSTAHSTSQNVGGTPTAQKTAYTGNAGSDAAKSKVFSILSYFGILCLLPFLFAPRDEFAKFHGKQGVVLLIFSLLIDLVSSLSTIAALLQIARLYLMIKGIINASQGKKEYLPYIGQLADKF